MDEISDFFDFAKPFKRVTVPVGYHCERADDKVSVNEIVKREEAGNDYTKVYVNAERQQILQAYPTASCSNRASGSRLSDLNDDSDEEMDEIEPKVPRTEEALYAKYNFNHKETNDLPINDNKMKILTALKDNAVIILQGDTGCGKTTQVPQFILDDACSREEYCNIVCTQPRRIAAISIAERVCYERKWECGSVVGYQVGLHAQASEDTRLLYCTTGVLLQKLIKTKDMSCYTHVILDEVHERDQDMDFLLIIIRRLLTTKSRNVKVILMSATIDTHEFSEYFKIVQGGTLVAAPIIKVDTRRLYTVKEFYLDQLNRLIYDQDNLINYEEPGILDEMYKVGLKLIFICRDLANQDYDTCDLGEDQKPSILVFLPGINEIDKFDRQLQKLSEMSDDIKILCIRLHSMISPDEQRLVFRKSPKNTVKVILATNIAESSITVPDVKYVIDFCLTKYLVTDTSTNLTTLEMHWASRANCKQRAGRAGRVMNGRVYRLVSQNFYFTMMNEHGTPEMTRCPLANIVLKAKLLDTGPPPAILALAMDPPNLSDIRNTILALKEAGALYKTTNGTYADLDGDLTYVGRVMAALPIDIHISRLIILGYIFSVLEEVIIIAAGLSVKSIFSNPSKEAIAAYSQKLAWSDGSGSDLFAILKAYKIWSNMKAQHNFEDEDTEASWARRFYINTKSMREMCLLITEIKDRLKTVGIKDATGPTRVKWLGSERTIILKIVIAGAFYPNYFLRTSIDPDSEREAYRVLSGRDPCNTVYFAGFEAKYIGQLYVQQIKDIFKQAAIQAKNIEVRFEQGSQKIFVTFKNDIESDYKDTYNFVLAIPGRIRSEVYKAIKIRQLRYSTTIRVMNPRDAVIFAQQKQLGVMKDGKWTPRKKEILNPELVVIPSLFTKFVRGKVTHIEHCGKFWFQPLSEEQRLREYTHDLNGPSSDIAPFNNPSEVSKGLMVAAPFIETDSVPLYYRAKVINLVENQTNSVAFRVLFIDYGNFEIIEFDKLRKLGRATNRLKDIPPRGFECFLSGIQPSSIKCPKGRWLDETVREMQTFVDRGIVEIEVYSVVNGITSAILKGSGGSVFNDLLVTRGFAQYTDENYMSKRDHDIRMRKQRISDMMQEEEQSENEAYLRALLDDDDVYTEPAPREKCSKKIDLRGPFSPLEAKVYAAMRIGGWKSVRIEQDSVNSVMLDNDPQDRHERLIVAASVSESGESGRLIARQTSLMPNIHGFSALVGLIFCPTMQIRRDPHKTKYVSVLAGLGANKHGQSLFEEHDIVFNLDVEISSRDLEIINQIRYSMDTLLYTDPGSEVPKADINTRNEMKAKIKNLIIELMEKQRKYIEVHRDIKEHIWTNIDEEDDLLVSENIYEDRSIFPFHFGTRLYNEKFERVQMLNVHCAELHRLSQWDISSVQMTCQLCDQHLETIVELRIHLLSQLHRDREYQIGYGN